MVGKSRLMSCSVGSVRNGTSKVQVSINLTLVPAYYVCAYAARPCHMGQFLEPPPPSKVSEQGLGMPGEDNTMENRDRPPALRIDVP